MRPAKRKELSGKKEVLLALFILTNVAFSYMRAIRLLLCGKSFPQAGEGVAIWEGPFRRVLVPVCQGSGMIVISVTGY